MVGTIPMNIQQWTIPMSIQQWTMYLSTVDISLDIGVVPIIHVYIDNPYFRLLNCLQNGYQHRVKIQKKHMEK